MTDTTKAPWRCFQILTADPRDLSSHLEWARARGFTSFSVPSRHAPVLRKLGVLEHEIVSVDDESRESPFWDPRLKEPQWIDPSSGDVLADHRAGTTSSWSIIVPAFRHHGELRRTLSALSRLPSSPVWDLVILQDLEPGAAIVAPEEFMTLPALWLSLRRKENRQFGDDGYRAGSVRNLGARYAHGEKFLFLDADQLVPADLLKKFENQFDESVFLQSRRWQLADVAKFSMAAETLSSLWDSVLSEKGVWEDFQARGEWNSRPDPWAWTSSFCLGVGRRRFEELGGFRSSFDRYGFEDTELGFRHWRAGGSFELVPADVFHQNEPKIRSEFQGRPSLRREIFSKSVQRFRAMAHDPVVDDWLRRMFPNSGN